MLFNSNGLDIRLHLERRSLLFDSDREDDVLRFHAIVVELRAYRLIL